MAGAGLGAGDEDGLVQQVGDGYLHHEGGDQLLQGQGARVTALPASSSQQVLSGRASGVQLGSSWHPSAWELVREVKRSPLLRQLS